LPHSNKTTGRIRLPSGRNATQIKTVLSEQWSYHCLSKTAFVVLRGHVAKLYGSICPPSFLTSTCCTHSTLKPSMPRWSMRKKAR
jgi:hypothetical protein